MAVAEVTLPGGSHQAEADMQTTGGDITENLQVLYSYSNLYSMLMMREKLLKMKQGSYRHCSSGRGRGLERWLECDGCGPWRVT